MGEMVSISERASVVKGENELSIVISSTVNRKKEKNIAIILGLWLIGGIVIGVNYFRIEDHNTKVFILVWLAFWGYFSYVIGKAFLWQRSGKELIKIKDGKLLYKRDVSGRGFVLDYSLEEISNLRKYGEKTPEWLKRFGGDYWSVDCDSIAFDFEGKEVPFGFKLSEKESEKIIRLIQPFLPEDKS